MKKTPAKNPFYPHTGLPCHLTIDDTCRPTTIEKAQLIVISFRGSIKELASLWKYQMKAYKQRRSLVLNVLTRWGTTVGLLNSVLNYQQALLDYFQQKNPGIDQCNGLRDQ